eukprot:scaffold1541_cov256-Pinguiococcus_pyrenoidosus.AAC.4
MAAQPRDLLGCPYRTCIIATAVDAKRSLAEHPSKCMIKSPEKSNEKRQQEKPPKPTPSDWTPFVDAALPLSTWADRTIWMLCRPRQNEEERRESPRDRATVLPERARVPDCFRNRVLLDQSGRSGNFLNLSECGGAAAVFDG